MPIYEYTCRKCSHQFEHLARTLSEPTPKCPECGAKSPTKGFSTFSAVAAASVPDACREILRGRGQRDLRQWNLPILAIRS